MHNSSPLIEPRSTRHNFGSTRISEAGRKALERLRQEDEPTPEDDLPAPVQAAATPSPAALPLPPTAGLKDRPHLHWIPCNMAQSYKYWGW